MKSFFGTDGIRNRVGTGLFTLEKLQSLGHSIAHWAIAKYEKPRILITSDSRASAAFIKASLKSSLLLENIQIYDGGELPTPMSFFAITKLDLFDCALVISASHNPWHDNGVKLFCRETGKLSIHDEQKIDSLLTNGLSYRPSYAKFGIDIPWNQALEFYSTFLLKQFPSRFLEGKHIVLDTAHGALSHMAYPLFTLFGANVTVINNSPTGYNINDRCGVLDPCSLKKAIARLKADIGFAFDGDGDRVLAINKHGTIKTGEDLLALLLTNTQ
ncbi:MAG TPA: hypothetical protein VHA52_13410, partial [Candidatus Babeliaceae bacterium]|nr:hypothetical protein [Candidatus Babeliaceae bacterium]